MLYKGARVVCAIVIVLVLASCLTTLDEDHLLGTWVEKVGASETEYITLFVNGTVVYEVIGSGLKREGTWAIKGDMLILDDNELWLRPTYEDNSLSLCLPDGHNMVGDQIWKCSHHWIRTRNRNYD